MFAGVRPPGEIKAHLRAQALGSETNVDHNLQEDIWAAMAKAADLRPAAIAALGGFWSKVFETSASGLGWLVVALRSANRQGAFGGSALGAAALCSAHQVTMVAARKDDIFAHLQRRPGWESITWR